MTRRIISISWILCSCLVWISTYLDLPCPLCCCKSNLWSWDLWRVLMSHIQFCPLPNLSYFVTTKTLLCLLCWELRLLLLTELNWQVVPLARAKQSPMEYPGKHHLLPLLRDVMRLAYPLICRASPEVSLRFQSFAKTLVFLGETMTLLAPTWADMLAGTLLHNFLTSGKVDVHLSCALLKLQTPTTHRQSWTHIPGAVHGLTQSGSILLHKMKYSLDLPSTSHLQGLTPTQPPCKHNRLSAWACDPLWSSAPVLGTIFVGCMFGAVLWTTLK